MDLRLWRVMELIKYEQGVSEKLEKIYAETANRVASEIVGRGEVLTALDEGVLAEAVASAVLVAYSRSISTLEPALVDTLGHEMETATEYRDAWGAYQTGGIGSVPGVSMVGASVMNDFVLASAVGWVFSGLFNGLLLDGPRASVLSQISRARAMGQSVFDLSKTVHRTISSTGHVAKTIGRTAIHRVSGRYNTLFHSRNRGLISKQKYTAVFDGRTCQICGGYDGSVFKTGTGPTIPVHENCRCQYVPIWEKASDPNVALSVDGSEPPRTTYHEWLSRKEKQMPGFARDILGATRYNAWRGGTLSLSDLTRGGKIRTLNQLGLEKVR